jgi:hypothetical protein
MKKSRSGKCSGFFFGKYQKAHDPHNVQAKARERGNDGKSPFWCIQFIPQTDEEGKRIPPVS